MLEILKSVEFGNMIEKSQKGGGINPTPFSYDYMLCYSAMPLPSKLTRNVPTSGSSVGMRK